MPDSLADHALPRSDLAPQMVWTDAAERDEQAQSRREGKRPRHWPREVVSSVEAVTGYDGPGSGITIHRPGPWRCRCPARVALGLDYRDVPAAWAAHAARATRLDEALLAAHMLVTVVGNQPEAVCACGERFRAPDSDPLNGDAAVALWAAHVEGQSA